ncbi:MAG: DUF308 domain-containing protein [Lachnospiraceae bacterium]
MDLIKKAKHAYITISVIMLVLGLVLLIWPKMSLSVLCYLIGAMLIIGGVVKLVGYFSKDLYRLAFQFDLAFGILSILLGVVFYHTSGAYHFNPADRDGDIHSGRGVLRVQTAMDAKTFGLSTWWMMILLAIATSACGLLLIFKPFESAIAMMMLLGVTLLIDGVQNLWVAIYTVKVSERNVIDVDYKEL